MGTYAPFRDAYWAFHPCYALVESALLSTLVNPEASGLKSIQMAILRTPYAEVHLLMEEGYW